MLKEPKLEMYILNAKETKNKETFLTNKPTKEIFLIIKKYSIQMKEEKYTFFQVRMEHLSK